MSRRSKEQSCLDDYEAIVKKYTAPLGAFFRSRGVSLDVEDLVQETFIRLFRGRETFRGNTQSELHGYIFAIASNIFRMHIRKQSRTKRSANLISLSDNSYDDYDIADAGVNAESRAIEKEKFKNLLSSINGLPDNLRRVFRLYLFGYSTSEIANLLNQTDVSVRVQLHRARKILSLVYRGEKP